MGRSALHPKLQDKIKHQTALGIPTADIAKNMDLDFSTVRKYGWKQSSDFDRESPSIKRALIELIERPLFRLLHSLNNVDVNKVPFNQRIFGIGVLSDKRQNLLGESDKPLIALQIVGLSAEQINALVQPSQPQQVVEQERQLPISGVMETIKQPTGSSEDRLKNALEYAREIAKKSSDAKRTPIHDPRLGVPS